MFVFVCVRASVGKTGLPINSQTLDRFVFVLGFLGLSTERVQGAGFRVLVEQLRMH